MKISVIIPSRNRYNYVLNLLNDLEQRKLSANEALHHLLEIMGDDNRI